jgi:hypothetical protein
MPWRLLSIILIFRATGNIVRTRTEDSFTVSCPLSCNLNVEANNFEPGAILLSWLYFQQQKLSSPEIEPRTVLNRSSGLCLCNLIFETNNSGLGAFLMFCLLSEPQKNLHRDLNTGQLFGGCGLRFCNVLFVTTCFSAVILSCLFSELQGTALTGNRTQGICPEFLSSFAVFPFSRNKHAKSGVHKHFYSQAINKTTNKYNNNFNFEY